MSHSVEGMLQLLKTHGPIWVTTDEDPSALFAIHARIITGMVGDGTPDGTLLRVTDPAGAQATPSPSAPSWQIRIRGARRPHPRRPVPRPGGALLSKARPHPSRARADNRLRGPDVGALLRFGAGPYLRRDEVVPLDG
jgi:Papain-like cysteine protease AvrRpt2